MAKVMVTLLILTETVIEVTEQDLGFTSQEWEWLPEADQNNVLANFIGKP